MALSADWQFELPSRSLLIGDGTAWDVLDVTGLDGQTVKTADLGLLGDGETLGVDRRGPRAIVFSLEYAAADASAMATAIGAFKTAWDIGGDTELHWQIESIHRKVTGRTRRWALTNQRKRAFLLASIEAEFYCGDPTITVV